MIKQDLVLNVMQEEENKYIKLYKDHYNNNIKYHQYMNNVKSNLFIIIFSCLSY